jgi:hypothetical protein
MKPPPRRTPGRHGRLRTVAFAAVAVLTVTVAGFGVPASAQPAVSSAKPRPAVHGTTVRGTVSGDHAWDPAHQRPYKGVPSVTVDQTTDLTDQVVHVTWKNFTPSFNSVGNFFSAGTTYYAVTVLECKGTHPKSPTLWKWPDFGPDCYNFTADNANAENGVGNQAYTVTGKNGEGEAYFHIETSVENNFLGCDKAHRCSLVVVPNWGGVQNPGSSPKAKDVDCSDHSGDTSFIFGNYAVDSSLGGACSWQDRIVVPLSFAPTPTSCPTSNYQFAAEGAPLLSRTFDQWRSGWCTGASHLTFDYDAGTNEDLARSAFLSGSGALTSAIDAAVVNRPASGIASQRKYRYAPVANTGIAIAFHIDDARTGKLLTHLVLDARLVAKLITQSYSLSYGCSEGGNTTKQSLTCDPGVKGNPIDIFDDPEFQKLNPHIPRTALPPVGALDFGQFLPLVINGDSDMVYQLTKWVWSNPAARAFLQGKPDPWGMHVNTYYKNEPMPTEQFQVLDPGYTAPEKNNIPGQSTMQVTWNPISGMSDVAESLVTDRPSGIDPTLPPCGAGGVPCIYQRFGSEVPGKRALFAIVGTVDAAADRFPTASLVNADGKAVAPTTASIRSTLRNSMTTDKNGVTQSVDPTSKNPHLYPLTSPEYAMVPTCGLPAKQASAVSQFLTLAAKSQHVGLQPGQLAPGEVPLLNAQLAQTRSAATAVSSTSCTTPTHRTHTSTPPPVNTGGNRDGGNGFGGGPPPTSAPPAPSTTPSSVTTSATPPTTSAPAPSTTPAAFGIKPSDATIDTSVVLPLTLLLGLLLFVGGPVAFFALNGGRGAAIRGRMRGLWRRGSHR